ncbi:UNVERIFIED_CONTAM: hypothetical protein RMT77_016908 [Armadillidium vulgare]
MHHIIAAVDNLNHSIMSMDHSSHGSHSGHDSNMPMMMMPNDEIATTESTNSLHSNHVGAMSGMQMYFHFGVEETILFYGWKTSTVGGLIGSMVGIFLIAFFYEGLKYFREYLFRRSLSSIKYSSTSNSSTSNQPVQYYDEILLPSPMHILSLSHMIQTLLHIIQFIISYCLMLIFMTYNVWLCLALTLGAGLGYFLFGWKKSVVVDVTEHCH